ncbi:aldo/keto reductase [Actinoalloteichus caeruleus]|uniref:aldo/keto reductase n=1 Tax=Actinoalloteichus cyanogriseus TaxID=2893586 RepID=UPI00068A3D4F|nr:aldo/keto reductase [Actinoalloteichus caeruleus]
MTNPIGDNPTRGPEAPGPWLGTMYFGTRVDENRSREILDRFAERGGRHLDTANCYCFWADGGTGDESEAVLGRWLSDRGAHQEMVVATKVGSRPATLGAPWPEQAEGLSAAVIREQFERSAERLRTDSVDLLYAHVEDESTDLEETLGAFAELVAAGQVSQIGLSNHRRERTVAALELAARHGWPRCSHLQQRYTYLVPDRSVPFGPQRAFDDEDLAHANAEGLNLVGYSPLLSGAYTRPDTPLAPEYRGAASARRLRALRDAADAVGATVNQVVLAWMSSGDPVVTPIVGVSAVAQLDEALDGAQLVLPEEVRAALDAA